jgi:tight adherence protein B
MELSAEAGALVLLALTLIVALLGLRILIDEQTHGRAMATRSALEDVERRAARPAGRLDAYLRRTGLGEDLRVRLAAAGVDIRLVDFLAVVLVVFALGTLLSSALLPAWLAILAGAACARGCWAWLEYRREQRREKFIARLPEIARLLSNASSAGLAMRTAIDMAAGELDEPARSEMKIVSDELAIGQSTEVALANLEKRMPSRDVGVLMTTLVIQQRAGGDLVRALHAMAETLDTRRDLRREVRTVMSGSIFTGYLVATMGVGALLLLNLINPGVIETMAAEPTGQVILLVAGALYAIGFVLVRRTTRIEV